MNCKQILEYHDELGFRCYESCVDESIVIIKEAANRVQEYLGLTVPIDADCKIGMNWAETH